MQDMQSLVHITNKVLEGLINEIKENETDLIVVQGDTSSAFAAALASLKQVYKECLAKNIDNVNQNFIPNN